MRDPIPVDGETVNRFVRVFVVVAIALVVCSPFAMQSVSGHRSVEIPPYRFVAGWVEEPAVAGERNALDLEIELLPDRTPVLDAHKNLTANLTKGSVTFAAPLAPRFGQPGRYTFVVIPTEPGNYTLRVAGILNGTAINLTVDLDEVVPLSDLQFPRPTPTPEELHRRIGDLQGQVSGLQGQVTTLLAVAAIGLFLAGISTTLLVLPLLRVRRRP